MKQKILALIALAASLASLCWCYWDAPDWAMRLAHFWIGIIAVFCALMTLIILALWAAQNADKEVLKRYLKNTSGTAGAWPKSLAHRWIGRALLFGHVPALVILDAPITATLALIFLIAAPAYINWLDRQRTAFQEEVST